MSDPLNRSEVLSLLPSTPPPSPRPFMALGRLPAGVKMDETPWWNECLDFDIRMKSDTWDTYPNDFKCWIQIRDHETGLIYTRRGYGKYIGNFSPIWVVMNGVEIPISHLETWSKQKLVDWVRNPNSEHQ